MDSGAQTDLSYIATTHPNADTGEGMSEDYKYIIDMTLADTTDASTQTASRSKEMAVRRSKRALLLQFSLRLSPLLLPFVDAN